MEEPRPAYAARQVNPHRLEYFTGAGGGLGSRPPGGVVVRWSIVLAAGWLPYLCGVLNALIVAQSYSTPIIVSHRWGAILFTAAGLALSGLALVGFARLRHGTGVLAAAVTIAFQAAICVCLGLTWA